MKKYNFSLLVFVVLFSLLGSNINLVQSAAPPIGTVRCYFYEPWGGTYAFTAYPQPASYNGTFSTDAEGKSGDTVPITNVAVKWSAVKELGNYTNEPLKE